MDSVDSGYSKSDQHYVIFETKEFKLDFNLFELCEYPNEASTDHLVQFRQAADVSPRDCSDGKYTRIRKLCYKAVDNILFAITVSENN